MIQLLSKRDAIWRLMRADRPIGTYLLAWPTLWALLIAGNGQPSLRIVVIFMLGTWLMRSAGCVINDYADRHVDGAVARTRTRPLATGEVSSRDALGVFVALLVLALLLVLQLNMATIGLSVVAVAIAALYPFCKRFTQGPQLVLGVAFSMGMLMAFTALEQPLTATAWLLFAANISWTVGYDTAYALADREDDVKVGIKSTAILFGRHAELWIMAFQLLTLILLALALQPLGMGLWLVFALAMSAALFGYQQWLLWRAKQSGDRALPLRAFLHNNYVGMGLTIVLAAHYWL